MSVVSAMIGLLTALLPISERLDADGVGRLSSAAVFSVCGEDTRLYRKPLRSFGRSMKLEPLYRSYPATGVGARSYPLARPSTKLQRGIERANYSRLSPGG